MQIFSSAAKFKNYTGTFTLSHIATQSKNQSFNIRKYDPTTRWAIK